MCESMSQQSAPLSLGDAYRLIRSQLEHEDAQINQRLSWFLMSHSFLFTAFAITTGNQAQLSGSNFRTFPLLVLIPSVALISSLLIGLSILAGILAMRDLRRIFSGHPEVGAETGLPALHGKRYVRVLGLVAPVALPLLFFAVWLFVLIRELP